MGSLLMKNASFDIRCCCCCVPAADICITRTDIGNQLLIVIIRLALVSPLAAARFLSCAVFQDVVKQKTEKKKRFSIQTRGCSRVPNRDPLFFSSFHFNSHFPDLISFSFALRARYDESGTFIKNFKCRFL